MLVKLGVDTSDLNAGMDRATRAVNKFGQDVENVGRRMAVGITLPIVGLGAAALKASADMESLKMGLTAITHSSAETEKQIARLKEVAKIPGLDFQGAVKGSINLQAAGFSAQMAERALKSFGNALATVGKGREDLEGVNLVLTQILNKPKVMAQDLNQLRERLPQISQAMKAAFGSSVSEDIQALGVTGEQFVAKIIAEFEKLPPVNSGLKNSFENLQDAAFQALVKIGDIVKPWATDFIQNRLNPMIDKVKEFAESFAKLPKLVRDVALGVGVAAASFPLLAIALGSTITNTIVIVGAFTKFGAILSGFAGMAGGAIRVLTLLAASTTALGAACAIAASAGVAALAIGLWKLVEARNAYKDAEAGAEQATKQQEAGLKSLEESLKKQGASIDVMSAKYKAGQITWAQYMRYLRDVATELGKSKKAHDEHTKAVEKFNAAAEKAHSYYVLDSLGAEQWSDAISRSHDVMRKFADALNGTKEYGAEVWSDLSNRVLEFSVLAEAAGVGVAQIAEVDWSTTLTGIAKTDALMEKLGLTSTNVARKAYEAALALAKQVEAQYEVGYATAGDVTRAAERVAKANKDLQDHLRGTTAELKTTTRAGIDFGRQVSTAISDLGKTIASVITLQKRWGDAAKDFGRTFVRIIVEDIVAYAFGKLLKVLKDDILPHLGKVGKALASILGGGGSAASGAAGATGGAASAGGSIASGAGGAASSASSGVMGALNTAFAGVSAGMAVIGGFQMAGMNKSLDVLVNHTLRIFNVVYQMLDEHYLFKGQLFTKMDDMWRTNLNIYDLLGRGGGTGGKGGITFNNCHFTGSPDQIANAIFTQAQLAGAI